MPDTLYDFAMVGLGTMGRNLLLNISDHGFSSIGFDRDPAKGRELESNAQPGATVKAAASLEEMVHSLKSPRKIMILVPAGPIVDGVINELLPLLQEGDIVIDGGNSHFSDTLRRIEAVKDRNIHFTGMGVSGGEHGARTGPSIMPGGDKQAWTHLQPILESIAAKVNNEPCVAYMGNNAAGHYVKMVHNGIEYGIMQLISEVYDFLKRGLELTNDELHGVFTKWNAGELQSFLIEITAGIFPKVDEGTGQRLVDLILDKAGSKGTGKWTSQEAMNLPVSLPTIDMAVAMRDLSGYKAERVQAAQVYKPKIKTFTTNKYKIVQQVGDALYAATLITYAQGLAMLQKASAERQMNIPMQDVVKIWRGGCIIRSAQLEIFTAAYAKQPALPNILLDKKIAAILKKKQPALRKSVQLFASAKIPAAAIMSALAYFDGYTSERMATNLIQAQRDFFGAHTYQRIDKEGSFHTEW
jgi:6-phosphogluconate dehydrogenase